MYHIKEGAQLRTSVQRLSVHKGHIKINCDYQRNFCLLLLYMRNMKLATLNIILMPVVACKS